MRAEEEAAERAALMAAVEAEIAALEAKKVQAQEIAKKNRVSDSPKAHRCQTVGAPPPLATICPNPSVVCVRARTPVGRVALGGA